MEYQIHKYKQQFIASLQKDKIGYLKQSKLLQRLNVY